MKEQTVKTLLSGVVIASIGAGAYYTFIPTASNTDSQKNSNSSTTTSTNTTSNTTETTTNNSTSASTTSGQMKDGTYTGEVVRTRRGDVQLSITVSGGKISEITPLIYPNEDRDSKQINANAIPKYVAEAIDVQSANITLISGATETYNGFTRSLQDAINKALQ